MRTHGRGFLLIGIVAILAGLGQAVVGLTHDRDDLLVRGGLFAVMGLAAIYVHRSQPRR